MTDQQIITFSGEPDVSANIDLSVPLPGAFSGRRLIEVTGISANAWSDDARDSGTDWATELGISKDLDVHVLSEPTTFIDRFYSGLRRAASVRALVGNTPELRKQDIDLMVDALQSATQEDASKTLRERGHLRDWNASINLQNLSIPTPGPAFKPQGRMQVSRSTAAAPAMQANDSLINKQRVASEAVNAAFQRSISQLDQGVVQVPATKWGGALTFIPVDLKEESEPRLFIIQVYNISSFLGDYGLGRTIKTFTLLPGEQTKISTRTWRATTETRAESTSIVDSFDENSSERFADTVLSETTDSYTQSKSTNWQVEGEAKASIGIASASTSAGGGGESSSSTEEFARAVDESVAEHTQEASSHRENTVTSSSESSEESGIEIVEERTIQNINVKRTLNFVFRELNHTYLTKTHLKDIRIAFTNGRAGSWRESPLSGLAPFIDSLFADKNEGKRVLRWILGYIAIVFDIDDTPRTVLERVQMDPCATEIESIQDARPGKNCEWPLPPLDMRFFYRFKRGDKNRRYAIGQENDEHPVEGVLLRQSEVTLPTDSIVVEALLGVNDALDQYSEDLQIETIRTQQLANEREALAQQLVNDGDTAKGRIFRQVFFESPSPAEE